MLFCYRSTTIDADELCDWESHPELLLASANAALRVYVYGWRANRVADEARATLRLATKFPGFSRPRHLAMLRYFGELFLVAKESVPRHVFVVKRKRSEYAQPQDIDAAACLAEIDRFAPGFAYDIKQSIVGFSIFYWYLK